MMKRVFTFGRLRRLTRDEAGGAIAELAILVPFLVVMLAAVAELGRFFQSYTTLSKSTRAASRYLSNHSYEDKFITRAKNIAYCGQITCAGADPVVTGLEFADVEVSASFATEPPSGNPETVTVNINNYSFTPIFDIGALLHSEAFTLALPIRPSTTMYYMLSDSGGAEEGGP